MIDENFKYLPQINFLDEKNILLIQEIILWKRPKTLIILILLINLIFDIIYFTKLTTIATIIFLILLSFFLRILWKFFSNQISNFLFPEIIYENDPESPNRIRSMKELQLIYLKFHKFFFNIFQWLRNYIQNPNKLNTFIFLSIMSLIFILFLKIGTYYILWILIHLILILPGFINSPFIRIFFYEKFEQVKELIKSKNE